MKKVLYISVITVLLLCLFGCSRSDRERLNNTTIPVTEATEATVGSTAESTTEKTTETITKSIITTKKETTTAVITKKVTTTQKQTTSQKATEIKPETTTTTTTTQKVVSTCTNNDNHSIMCGGMGKWFDSRSEVQDYVGSVMESWNNKLRNGEITWEEYTKNCPQGYKSWSCSCCGKWTGNFIY